MCLGRQLLLQPGVEVAAGHLARDLQARHDGLAGTRIARRLLHEDDAVALAEDRAEPLRNAGVVGGQLAEVAVRRGDPRLVEPPASRLSRYPIGPGRLY